MGNEFSKELNLAAELRSVCDLSGKETDTEKSAPIFHQFANLYRTKSPDKISLIRSAVFFNAVVVRQPHNNNAMENLQELCAHVLDLAGAKKRGLNCIALKTKNKIYRLRRETEEELHRMEIIPVGLPLPQLQKQKTKKIKIIRNLQAKITSSYVSIMDSISKKCIKLMGKPPCQYAVVGMGSLARKEVTPYSDFEHVIVVEEGVQFKSNYQDVLEYFRWFTVIFQLVIISLGETIIPSVSIPLLNNPNIPGGDWFFDSYTTRGISFDGMMLHACKFPLGRFQPTANKPFVTELIKPVSEMAKYLQSDEDIKNGYHLADVLTRTCFVSGSKTVYKQFELLAQQVLDCNFAEHVYQIKLQVRKDLKTYNAQVSLHTLGVSENWNIKRVIYRSITLFVSTLGRLHLIEKYSSFEIIDELLSKKKIEQENAEKFVFAVAVACEIRLKVYMSKKSQNDYVGDRRHQMNENKITRKLSELVGEQSIGDYFLAVEAFQFLLQRNDFEHKLFLENRLHAKFRTLFMLDLHNLVLAEWERYQKDKDPYIHAIVCYYVAWTYVRKEEFGRALEIYNNLETYFEANPFFVSVDYMRRKARCLCEIGRHQEGLQYINKCMSRFQSLGIQYEISHHALGYMMALQGDCQRHLGKLEKAVRSYSNALINISYSTSCYKSNLQAKCYYFLAQCKFEREKYSEALENANTALSIREGSHIEISLECKCNRLIGDCYMRLNRPQAAVECFKKELQLRGYKKEDCSSLNNFDASILFSRIQAAIYKLNST